MSKNTKKRVYRRRDSESGDDARSSDDEGSSAKLSVSDILELQKLKKRPSGLSAVELALGREAPREIEFTSDPLKLKTGGVIDLKMIKKSDINNADIEEGIKKTFSKESHLRDEDEEMRRYVEEELAKRKGQKEEVNMEEKRHKQLDDVLYELPEHLKQYQSKRTEDMLSNQMLCGIPEVDLGIDAKIKNIEETEAAKLKLLKEAVDKKRNIEETLTARQNLVKDLAQGYVQHNYYKIDEVTILSSEGARKEPLERVPTEAIPVVAEDTPRWLQNGREVQRPKSSAPSRDRDERKLETQPSDKAIFDTFKRKYTHNQKR